ncbi:TetR/AcrR family transcriptional regulator [Actinoallomurus purpureus]|uniref:TetR/AcrR family transcriptional regulator n=1 Tax=Actinoallomurus purpureus TaxID=478114 RepID=UPI0020924ED1|nr:TetR/AcrR family transcriptional regulator [Actinoallomurus purpureus]MCO6007627.1 TetR/AcrR family transcriptional regulator [Actinoallomurus purpureus]
MSGATGRTTAPPRADARRNRARVLRAAQEAFAADGLSVPLDEIARRAGVGPGTIYRHFASKETLFEAVVIDRIGGLVDETSALAAVDDPGAAFFDVFALVVERTALNKALCEALMAGSGYSVKVAPELRERYRSAFGTLLEQAQRAGAVRADVTVDDVQRLALGCVSMERDAGGSAGRATALVCDGLRPARDARRSLPAVTESTPERYESRSAVVPVPTPDLEPTRCAECGEPIRTARTGRRARYCGSACRQRAHRRRAAG